MSGDLTGGCSCGRIRFRLTAPPELIAACHCKDCRRHTGAPVSVFVDVKQANFETLAAPVDWFETSPGAHRGFCSRCGATLAFRGSNRPDEIHLHVGAFDTPELLPPARNEETQSRLPWLHVFIQD